MSRPAVLTIAAENYLPLARVLRDSHLRFHSDIPLFLLLAAPKEASDRARSMGFDLIMMEELAAGARRERLTRRDRRAWCASLKPVALRHLLGAGFDPVIFLDPDIWITAALTPVIEEVAQHALTLTPHIRNTREEERRRCLEHTLLMAGMYNGGFVGLTRNLEALRFLDWWDGRLRTHCRCELENGIHYDQRWLDLAPGFVGRFHLLRDEGSNVAYWNLAGADFARIGGQYFIDGVPLRFFHFSGFDPARPEEVSRYWPGAKVRDLGAAAELFRHYAELVRQAQCTGATEGH